ncbi:hypothetical protein Ancab_012974 [Ancistrocladus abbreviatus]
MEAEILWYFSGKLDKGTRKEQRRLLVGVLGVALRQGKRGVACSAGEIGNPYEEIYCRNSKKQYAVWHEAHNPAKSRAVICQSFRK